MPNSPIDWNSYWKTTKINSPFKMLLDSTLKLIGLDKILSKRSIKICYDLLKDIKNPIIIEAGCGTAALSLSLKSVLQGAQLILIDISPEVLSGIEKAKASSLIQGDIISISLLSDCCHLCCNIGTIEHFTDPQPIIQEMCRVSKKFVLCAVPAPSMIWKSATLLRRFTEKDSSLWTEHTFWYSKEQLLEIFNNVGLRDLKIVEQKFMGFPLLNIVWGKK